MQWNHHSFLLMGICHKVKQKALYIIFKGLSIAKSCLSPDNESSMASFSNATLAGIYLFKVNNGNSRTTCYLCSKLTIMTLKRRHWRSSGISIDNFEHVSNIALVLPSFNLNSEHSGNGVFLEIVVMLWFFNHLRCVARFGTIYTIWKTIKTLMEE